MTWLEREQLVSLEGTIRKSAESKPIGIHTQAVIDRELVDLCRPIVWVLSDVHLRLSVVDSSQTGSH